MLDTKTNDIPMATTTKLDNDEVGIGVDETMYREMIGSLLYLTASGSNIVFSVGICTILAQTLATSSQGYKIDFVLPQRYHKPSSLVPHRLLIQLGGIFRC